MATPGNGGPAPSPEAQQSQAQLSVLGQYIKDFSFENPNAPRSLAPSQTQPAINIQINVGVQQLGETDYEISLKLEGKAESSGTLLFAFDLGQVGRFLRMPARQPQYRERREHAAFLRNLPAEAGAIKRRLQETWQADEERSEWPRQEVARLVAEKYEREEWLRRR